MVSLSIHDCITTPQVQSINHKSHVADKELTLSFHTLSTKYVLSASPESVVPLLHKGKDCCIFSNTTY